jgi:hypothetical protein
LATFICRRAGKHRAALGCAGKVDIRRRQDCLEMRTVRVRASRCELEGIGILSRPAQDQIECTFFFKKKLKKRKKFHLLSV